MAAAVHVLGMTPNTATAISAAMSGSALAVLAIAEPTWPMGLLVASLLAAGYVMDSVDGQLARLTGNGTLSGEWLDHTIDSFKTSALHLVVLISWYRFPPYEDPRILLIPIAFQVIQMVEYFGIMSMPELRKRGGDTDRARAQVPEHWMRKWLLLPNDYGVICWSFALMGWPTLFFLTYTLFFVANTGAICLALRKWWRELRRLDIARA